MATIYDYSKYPNIFVIGEKRASLPVTEVSLYHAYPNKSIIILMGCYLFNNEDKNQIQQKFQNLNTYFDEHDFHLFILKGSHENPSFFNDDIFDMPRIHVLQDYSVLKTKKHNILCIGGSFPFDRNWLQSHSKFYDNTFVYDEDKINDVLSCIKIDSVITQAIPPKDGFNWETASLDYWKENDDDLIDDYNKCNAAIEKLHNLLCSSIKLKFWITSNVNGGIRRLLDKNNNMVILQYGINSYDSAEIDAICKDICEPKTKWGKIKSSTPAYSTFSIRYEYAREGENQPQVELMPDFGVEEIEMPLDDAIMAEVHDAIMAEVHAQAAPNVDGDHERHEEEIF